MLQLCAGSKGDAAHADVLGGDVVFLALVATGEGEAEGPQVIQLHAIAVEESIGEVPLKSQHIYITFCRWSNNLQHKYRCL